MAYTPNPTNASQPSDAIFAQTAAAEFRALKQFVIDNVVADRMIRLPPGQTFTELPNKTTLLEKFIYIDSGGNPVGVAATPGSAMDVLAYLADTVDPAKGAGAVGYTAGVGYGAGTVGYNLNLAVGIRPTGGDDTAAVLAYLASTLTPVFGPGVFHITQKLVLSNNHKVTLHPATEIQQLTADTPIFEAVTRDGITINCNYAKLKGEGTWSAAWTGSSGHFDRAFNMLGCTNLVIDRPHTYNNGLAGIAVIGGDHVRINFPWLEGTNTYSTPIPGTGNFQFGLYLRNDPTYGALNDCQIFGPNISGSAIGVLYEQEVLAPQPTDPLVIVGANVHDITGQHAFYMTSGNFIVSACCSDIYLSAFKVQAGDANLDIAGWKADIVAKDCGSQMFEIAVPVPYTGIIRDFEIDGVGFNVARAASFARNIQHGRAELVVENCTDVGLQFDGANNQDVEVWLIAKNVAQSGVLVGATASSGLKIHPTIRQPNTSASAAGCGILIASASANVELYDVDITDSGVLMKYGLFNSVVGSVVRMYGTCKLTGASDTAVRATGQIFQWPTECTLQGTNGAFTDTSQIRTKGYFVINTETNANGLIVLWQRNMADQTAMMVEVDLVVSKGLSVDRGAYKLIGHFYRQGGGVVTVQGAVNTIFQQETGTLGITKALQGNGANDVVLTFNPNSGVNCKIQARITCTDSGN